MLGGSYSPAIYTHTIHTQHTIYTPVHHSSTPAAIAVIALCY